MITFKLDLPSLEHSQAHISDLERLESKLDKVVDVLAHLSIQIGDKVETEQLLKSLDLHKLPRREQYEKRDSEEGEDADSNDHLNAEADEEGIIEEGEDGENNRVDESENEEEEGNLTDEDTYENFRQMRKFEINLIPKNKVS